MEITIKMKTIVPKTINDKNEASSQKLRFPKIVPSASRPFIGHHQGLLACVRCVCIFLKRVLKVFESLYHNKNMGMQSWIKQGN